MKLRYSEAFYSVQGEGKFVGVPSVFLRTFGCNFRCMNFGVDKSVGDRWDQHARGERYNAEVKALIDAGVHETTEKFEDLPIVHTGCDTYASIYPEFKDFNKLATIDEVVDHLLSLLPEGKWTMDNGQDVHLILTGGEPLLAWQRLYVELFEHPKMKDLKNVTIETNTTQTLHSDFAEYLSTQGRFTVTLNTSALKDASQLHFHAVQSSPLVENLGKMLLSLKLLANTLMYLIVTFILSLWLPIKTMLTKLLELFSYTGIPGWNVQYILCRWADAVKNIPSMFKKSRTSVCDEDGDSAPDSTYRYSGMPGGLSKEDYELLQGKKITEEQYDKIRKQL